MRIGRFGWLVVCAAACSDPGKVSVKLNAPGGGAVPSYGEVPMPSDVFLSPGGRIETFRGLERVVPAESDILAAHLSTLDGFGLRPLIELFLDGAIDPATLPAHTEALGDAAVLIDLSSGTAVPMEWRYDPERLLVSGSPALGVVLREGARYAAVLTRDVYGGDGEPLRGFGEPEGNDRWRSTIETIEQVEDLAGFADRIAGLTAFTTQHATGVLARARGLAEQRAPVLTFPNAGLIFDTGEELDRLLGVPARDEQNRERWGWSNPTGIAHEHVGVIASGVMTVPRFLRPERGDLPEHETFDVDPATGDPRVLEEAHEIPVTFVLPKAAPRSPAGYPTVIFGHGLGASRHAVVTFAEPLAEAGFAIAAIDMDGHGSRFNSGDRKNNTADVIDGFTGEAELADGFGDTTGTVTTLGLIHGFKNLSAVRDSVRQSVLDLGSLAILIQNTGIDLSALSAPYGGQAPKLDGSKLAYLGESYGGVVGSVFAAIEPRIALFVLDVPGAGIIDLEIAESPGLYGPVVLFARSVYEFTGKFDRFHPVAAFAQAIIDGADPLSYAPHVLRDRLTVGDRVNDPRSFVAIEVVGDEIMSNTGTEALARALGLSTLEPYLHLPEGTAPIPSPASSNADGQTAVLVQYSPATHGANWTSEVGTMIYQPGFPHEGEEPFPLLPEPIEIRNPIRETLEQVIELLETHLDGAPAVRSVLAPIADFDGDGVTDEEETQSGRNPWNPNG